MKTNPTNDFYVYVYLDPRKDGKYTYNGYEFSAEPFYVGKGKENRHYFHVFESMKKIDCKKARINRIQQIKKETSRDPIIIKIKENLDEQEAYTLEKNIIDIIGRHDLGHGPLLNLNNNENFGYYDVEEILEKEELEKITQKEIKKIYSFKETCDYLRISESQLKNFINNGTIIPICLNDGNTKSCLNFSDVELEKIIYVGLKRSHLFTLNFTQFQDLKKEIRKKNEEFDKIKKQL